MTGALAVCSGLKENSVPCNCRYHNEQSFFQNDICTYCQHHRAEHPPPPGTSSVTKQKQYKVLSVEASARKFLDAIARNISQLYHFKWAYRCPTIGDVFKAKDEGYNNSKDDSYGWDYVLDRRLEPRTSIPLPEIFTEEQWKELWEMNKDTNDRIHNSRLPETSSGKPFVILPHDKFTKKREAMLKGIAATVNIVFDPDEFIVKDEAKLSGSSGSEKSSPDKTD